LQREAIPVLCKMFIKKMEELKVVPSMNTYDLMMAGYIRANEFTQAHAVFNEMKKQGVKPSLHIFDHLITMTSFTKEVHRIEEILNEMKNDYQLTPSQRTLNFAVMAYIRNGNIAKATEIIQGMKIDGKEWDLYTVTSYVGNIIKIDTSNNAELQAKMNRLMRRSSRAFRMNSTATALDLQDLTKIVEEYQSYKIDRRLDGTFK